jgi:hypothetical protein
VSRRNFREVDVVKKLVATVQALLVSAGLGADPVEIGPRRELLVDDFLIDSMQGQVRLQLHRPVRREIVFKTDAPWEGNASAFQSVFQDGPLYRMYYRGLHYATGGPATETLEHHPWVLCYAESDDGVHWRRPKLGVAEFKGSKANNIILTPKMYPEIGGDPAHSSVFKDANPSCPPDEKYKLVVVGWRKPAMYALKSADGVHFSPLSREPIVTAGDFDSQNLAFWDPVRKEYREYHRGFKDGVRAIMTAASKDFRHFPKPEYLVYPGAPKEHLYTNQVQPYYRAPHILVGFPMRYVDRGWSDAMFDLPGTQERVIRAKGDDRYGTAVTDALFMTSRDGRTFRRWPEAFIRPGPRQRHSWVYGDNFVFWGMVETKSATEDAPDEISLYATESYWEGTATEVRRYTIRNDGFVSAAASLAGGQLVTKPLIFEGGNLTLNMETSAAGGVQVEIQDAGGRPIEGYALAECPPIPGDHLCQPVRWKERGGDVRSLAGKPVRLRFVLRDADLYAFQFVPYQPDPKRPDITRPPAPAKKPAR